MKTDVFISHSSVDREIANALCALLERRKIRCWIAPRDVPAGGIWAAAIVEALENTRVMVLLFSSHSNASRQVINEVQLAVSKGVIVLPVRVEKVKPSKGLEYFLGSRHWLDALTPPMERRLEEVGEQIARVLADPASPLPPPPPPPPTGRKAPVAVLGSLAIVLVAAAGVWWWHGKPLPSESNTGGDAAISRDGSSVAVSVDHTPLPDPVERRPAAAGAHDPGSDGAQSESRADVRPETRRPGAAAEPVARGAESPSIAKPVSSVRGTSPRDVLLVDTVWVGELVNGQGAKIPCLGQIDRRAGDNVTMVVYFPFRGPTPYRWAGTLDDSSVTLDGVDPDRQRVSVTGRMSDGRLVGTWINNGGHRGELSFAPNRGTAESLDRSGIWPGELGFNRGSTMALNLRVVRRQGTRLDGRATIAAQRLELNVTGTVLGDRLFGRIAMVPLTDARRESVYFDAIVQEGEIAGRWMTDGGLGGTVRWTREPTRDLPARE